MDVGPLHGFEFYLTTPGGGVGTSYGVPLGNPRNMFHSFEDSIHTFGQTLNSEPALRMIPGLQTATGIQLPLDNGSSPNPW